MKRLFARLATVVAAVPLVMAPVSGSAHAGDTTVPGCYGVGVVVCNLTITIGAPIGVETYQTSIPICAGSCSTVPVTLVRTTAGEPVQACYRYSDYYGSVSSYCADGSGGGGLVDQVEGEVQAIVDSVSIEEALYTVGLLVEKVEQRINDLIGSDVCLALARALYAVGIDIYCY